MRLSMLTISLSVVAVVLTILSLSWWEWQEGGVLRKETNPNVELSRQTAAAAHRSEAKNLVVRRLLAGELILFEAAAWFRHIDGSHGRLPGTELAHLQWGQRRGEDLPSGHQVG